LNPSDATIYIDSFTSIADFKDTIENAPKGSIIYIDGNLSIDLTGIQSVTGAQSINIPSGVTIASNRGISSGALIKTDDYALYPTGGVLSAPIFNCVGDDIRITGIRLQGPANDAGSSSQDYWKIKYGIKIGGPFNNLEVDNCEVYNFPYAGIQIGSSTLSSGNKVHHNYIHNNIQNGLGYGIYFSEGYGLVFANLFEFNRHDIAGGGQPGSGYEAACNLIRTGGTSHNFDMHAEGPQDGTPNAGSFIFIHHNDFEDIGVDRYEGQGKNNVIIRGRPGIQCRIENNRFKHNDPHSAILQINKYGGYGNMLVWNNIYNEKDYLGWYVKKKWLKSNASNFVNLISYNDDLMHNPATGSDYVYNYTFGDYDGDGNTDIFKLENGFLYTLPLNASTSGQSTSWQPVLKTAHSFASLHFGFYDSDDRTDMIVQDGNTIDISSGANSPWEPMLNTTYPLESMIAGDFDGNGIEDLFLANGFEWKVSYDSRLNWQTIKTSNENLDQLKLGYFNNNRRTDVLMVNTKDILVSFDSTSNWSSIGSAPFEAAELEVADFDGDNLSDIIQPMLGKILINGKANWQSCNTDNFPIASLPYGDF
jgi:hypothetical protein